MSITHKTRKVLWGRSGNLCAFCKTRLVVDASDVNSESVVGDECHIISGATNGPRHNPSISSKLIDHIDNLLLLCRVHHKLVDDQPDTFTVEALCQLKANHEKWVTEKLEQSNQPEPIRIVRNSTKIPEYLMRITSAKTLLNIATICHGYYHDYPDDLTERDLDYVGEFLQNLKDWVDIGIDEPYERINAQKSLAEGMSTLDKAGLRVYVAREKQQLRGGIVAPSEFYTLHLRIIRHDDPRQFSYDHEPES